MKSLANFFFASALFASAQPVETHGTVGCLANPKAASRLEITRQGVYENCLINAGGKSGNIVKITADDASAALANAVARTSSSVTAPFTNPRSVCVSRTRSRCSRSTAWPLAPA